MGANGRDSVSMIVSWIRSSWILVEETLDDLVSEGKSPPWGPIIGPRLHLHPYKSIYLKNEESVILMESLHEYN